MQFLTPCQKLLSTRVQKYTPKKRNQKSFKSKCPTGQADSTFRQPAEKFLVTIPISLRSKKRENSNFEEIVFRKIFFPEKCSSGHIDAAVLLLLESVCQDSGKFWIEV